MLPLEIALAEPNSGKSFLYNLRKGILTGHPRLFGIPDDFRSWVASVGSAPGIWVADNLGSVRGDYWHRFNDELARLITDPYPTIDLRELFTTAGVRHVPVNCTFAITTTKNPFTAPDVLQRCLIFQLKAIPVGLRNGDWYHFQLKDREGWLAEHLAIIQRFFNLVSEEWQEHYQSGYRLVGFEQSLLLMGKALGWDISQVVAKLPYVVAQAIAVSDPVMEALKAFTLEWPYERARLRDVIEWVEQDEDRRFTALKTFDNVVLLGRYLESHAYDVEQSAGISATEERNVTILYLPEDRDIAAIKSHRVKAIAKRLRDL